jgi:hypothetical protein
MRLISILFVLISSASCTMAEVREYTAVPEPSLPANEVAEVFLTFRFYLGLMGYEPRRLEDFSDPNHAVYRISGPQSDWKMAMRQDIEDFIELKYEGGETFIVRLIRIQHGGNGLTEETLRHFRNTTERFIFESTKKVVRLKLMEEE